MKLSLLVQIELAALAKPEEEFRFAPPRRWRFDYAWPSLKIAVEIEGGTFLPGGGRHNRPQGFRRDIEKYNTAELLGWHLFRVTTTMIRDGSALAWIERAHRAFGEGGRDLR